MPTKPVIFLAFANDREDNAKYLRNLPVELSQIRDALKEAEKNNLCEVVERANVSINAIFDVFQDNRYRDRIAIFHYGGHADGYQLLLENLDLSGLGNLTGLKQTAHGEGLVSFLSKQKGLTLVFFNGCTTQQQAQELAQAGIPAVIGTSSEIDDTAATHLATRFYKGLGQQIPLQQAWEQAIDEVKTIKGDNVRGLYRKESNPQDYQGFPWEIMLKESVRKWVVKPKEYILNEELTKVLAFQLKTASKEFSELWQTDPIQEQWGKSTLQTAKKYILAGFVSPLGFEIGKLFAMTTTQENYIQNYIKHCLLTSKLSIQLSCFALLSDFWKNNRKLSLIGEEKLAQLFFHAKRPLTISDWHWMLSKLIAFFTKNNLVFPIQEIEDLVPLMNEESPFGIAIQQIESLEKLSPNSYSSEHCQQAETVLASLLSIFKFWASYKLVSIRDITYYQFRDEQPHYVKSIQVLKIGENSQTLMLKYDDKPIDSLSVFLQNNKATTRINLSPFILDFNAFDNNKETRLCLYEHRERDSSLVYFFLDTEEFRKIDYQDIVGKSKDSNSLIKQNEEKTIKLDSMILNFQQILNQLMGSDFHFSPFANEVSEDLSSF